jgi:hypothetical protein
MRPSFAGGIAGARRIRAVAWDAVLEAGHEGHYCTEASISTRHIEEGLRGGDGIGYIPRARAISSVMSGVGS